MRAIRSLAPQCRRGDGQDPIPSARHRRTPWRRDLVGMLPSPLLASDDAEGADLGQGTLVGASQSHPARCPLYVWTPRWKMAPTPRPYDPPATRPG